jgi:exopolysaccharide biosynthesis polyprenyl glycosylphosphotransferase
MTGRLRPRRPTLVVGSGTLARRLVATLAAAPGTRSGDLAVVSERPGDAAPPGGVPVAGALPDLGRLIAALRPRRIVVALEERRGRLPADPLLEARVRGVAVEDGVAAYERLTGKLAIEALNPGAIIFGGGFRVPRAARLASRLLSLAVAVAGLIAGAPLGALIALLIALDSRGGVFFVQERVGLDGRRFHLLKFRSMHPAAAAPSEWARDNGDRITRVGRWLRRFRLDELPQFLNILRGDMDLIGPRPHPASNVALFLRTVPYYALRMSVRPGMTGWAQVRYGYANNLEEETEKMRYDLYYIKHRGLALDLRILCDTLRIVLLGRGAERTVVAAAPGRMAIAAPGGGAAAARLLGPASLQPRGVPAAARHHRPGGGPFPGGGGTWAGRGTLLLFSGLVLAGAAWGWPAAALAAPAIAGDGTGLAADPAALAAGFAPGDLFVSLRTGQVQWFGPDGRLKAVLANRIQGKAEGMGFDAAGNLYVTHYCADASWCLAGNAVEVFDPLGTSRGAFGGGYDCNPYAVAFDRGGRVYVGQADCTGDLLVFDAGGARLAALDVAIDWRGAARIDLAPDGCTLHYTSQGPNVKRYDVCAGRQLADFNAAPLPGGVAHALRLLPDGGALVAVADAIARLDARGVLTRTYDVSGEPDLWLGLDLAGDGTFWASNYGSSNVVRFDLATGTVLAVFNTGTPTTTIKDVLVRR